MAAARKNRATPDKSRRKQDEQPKGGPVWDPAAVTPSDAPTLREEEERAFHATHFSADPRGAAMAGKAPPGKRPKRRGGAGPRRSGPAGV